MEEPVNTFDLSPEQQETTSLLDRLLGKAIADRYVDFCRLAAGAFALKVSRPLAAHALRELDSTLRQILEMTMEVKVREQPDEANKREEVRQNLRAVGCFDEAAINRAVEGLRPRVAHKTRIKEIVKSLGLNPEGDIANLWISLNDSFGKAHERHFHRSMEVDDEFRSQYQVPFDTVIRALAVALEGRYLSLMRRVEELAALSDRALASASFAHEIPSARPLQWHFFQRLTTGDWLPHLARNNLLGVPLVGPEEGAPAGIRYRQWPAGNYLRRMAESADPAIRAAVVQALRAVDSSSHPDVQHDGIEILAALPPEESAPLADLAVAWLDRDTHFGLLQAPENLLKKLAEGNQCQAALRVARALLQLWNDDGQVRNLYGRHMYEYRLPFIMSWLNQACGEDALHLVKDLLLQAGEITGQIRYDHHSARSVADDDMAKQDTYSALISAVRRSAETLVADNPDRMRSVVDILTSDSIRILIRVALHVLAQNPAMAPDLAESYLVNPELIEETWPQNEYADLALAWFPSLSPEKQETILGTIDSIPDRHQAAWRARYKERHGEELTSELELRFAKARIRDAVWRWRSVLPSDRQEAVDRIAQELGDPDAWRLRMFPPETSPLSSTEFAARPIADIVAYLAAWQPAAESQSHTVTALAQELRAAVGNDPKSFATNAEQFAGLKPIYIRRILEGLLNSVSNQRDFEWGSVLKLIEFTYSRANQVIDPTSLSDGDDRNSEWACMTASELLAAGLRRGAGIIGFEHAPQVRSLVFNIREVAPSQPNLEDIEDRFKRSPYFAAQATLRGMAVELCILLMFWLSKDVSSSTSTEPSDTIRNLPDVRQAIEKELADHSQNGRIPRAIIGRWLSLLDYFGKDWLSEQLGSLLPAGDDDLRLAAWRSHLGHDSGPVPRLMPQLHKCYLDEIEGLFSGDLDREFREYCQKRLADYILILHLQDSLPDELFEQFRRNASEDIRREAMWFVVREISRPPKELAEGVKARGLAYWEGCLADGIRAIDKDPYRAELGVVSQLCFHSQVDEGWLCDQLIQMLNGGFIPSQAYSVIEWLSKVSPRHRDRAVEVLGALLHDQRVDRWDYITQRDAIRNILSEGLASGITETIDRVRELVSFLATIGETSFLDLLRRPDSD